MQKRILNLVSERPDRTQPCDKAYPIQRRGRAHSAVIQASYEKGIAVNVMKLLNTLCIIAVRF